MALPSKPLDQITEADLLALIQAGEAESKVIEYKEILPGNSDSDKKEFLYEVSSFANASGGTLIYGMKATDGVPLELIGIAGLNPDAETLRLHSIIQSGLQPRIPGIEITSLTLSTGNKTLLVGIPRSWAPPHMVTFKGGSKFYSRHSNGKYQLDVNELRAAFLASETVSEKIEAFRVDRLAKILNDEIPIPIKDKARLVLHLLPISSFTPGFAVDVKKLTNMPGGSFAPMRVSRSYGGEYNFDGYVFYERLQDKISIGYTQVFRNGCMEVLDSSILAPREDAKLLYATQWEALLVGYFSKLLALQKYLGVSPPFIITLSHLRIRDYSMAQSDPCVDSWGQHPVDRDHLSPQAILLESFDCDPAIVLKPAFDAVWNACGFPGSASFDEQGRWKARR